MIKTQDLAFSYTNKPFIENINFEVAVNIEEKSGSGASISVLSAFINGKVQGNSANANTQASKISFVVPVYYAERMVNS